MTLSSLLVSLSTLLVVVVPSVIAQSTISETANSAEIQQDPPAPAAHEGSAGGYRLGPDDVIVIRVPDAEEIPAEPLRIDGGGNIRLPLIGTIQAAGLTAGEVEAVVIGRLGKYFVDPEAMVSVQEFRSQPVSVIGAVQQPGVHQLEGRRRLIEILSLAGGTAEDAGDTVKIMREIESGPIPLPGAALDQSGRFTIGEVRLKDVIEARKPEHNILIKPNDVVTVPRADMIYVIGAVRKSGGFVLADRDSVSILEALALAGGLESTAKKKMARVLRTSAESDERTEILVDLRDVIAGRIEDQQLRKEDILYIPTSGGKMVGVRAIQTAVNAATGIAIWRVGNN